MRKIFYINIGDTKIYERPIISHDGYRIVCDNNTISHMVTDWMIHFDKYEDAKNWMINYWDDEVKNTTERLKYKKDMLQKALNRIDLDAKENWMYE